jgi:hypothetical protein
VLALVLGGVIGQVRDSVLQAPPAVPAITPTPIPAAATSVAVRDPAQTRPHEIVNRPSLLAGAGAGARTTALYEAPATAVHIAADWVSGFYPIYATAQKVFGVNWLLIASIHMQESAFSTDPTTYHGLNFAHCCGGPMQFNVTNGGGRANSTWALVSDSYVYGARPASYDHMTVTHPSIYDDFDSIMAAAHLLSADGAGSALDGGAWNAAYDYYGHDSNGVTYADQVLARAISWSQHGFCINCGLDPSMVAAVHAAYGAQVAAALQAQAATETHRAKPRRLALSARRRHGR